MSGGRKRKAEELEEEPRDGSNGARASKQEPSAQELISTPAADIVYMVLTAPVKPPKAGLFRGKAEIAHNFTSEYEVSGGDWGAMKNYKKISLPDQTFQMNDIVYILKEGDLPPPPNEDEATPLELLRYDRQVYAVGKILDCRASSRHDVHVLIAYLYWPEELPDGRQPHHSEGELILSNHFEIIDPQSMSSISEITHWNEWNDESGIPVPERFWRQTYSIEHKNTKTKGFSKLRAYCKCDKPHNPDHKMYQCGHCNTWNHEKCLVQDVAAIAYRHYKDGTLDDYSNNHKPPESVLERLKTGLTKTLENVGNAFRHDANGSVESPSKPKKGRPKKNVQPWESQLSAEIIEPGSDAPPAIRIVEKEGQQRHWNLTVDCLKCGKLLD